MLLNIEPLPIHHVTRSRLLSASSLTLSFIVKTVKQNLNTTILHNVQYDVLGVTKVVLTKPKVQVMAPGIPLVSLLTMEVA